MSNGVYVLVTKDGYRVAYSDNYDALFGRFIDAGLNYLPDVPEIKRIFGKSEVFSDESAALNVAKDISKNINETDDGIMFIRNYPEFTFEELISGNKT
jgi:hypothetical protein